MGERAKINGRLFNKVLAFVLGSLRQQNNVTKQLIVQERLTSASVHRTRPAVDEVEPCTMDSEMTKKSQVHQRKRTRRRGPRLTGISKERRLANARERRRVDIMNEQIQILRGLIPLDQVVKKMTKIDVIWEAAMYIGDLTELLNEEASSPQSFQSVESAGYDERSLSPEYIAPLLDVHSFSEEDSE